MGYPMRNAAVRAALIGAMLGGGLLFAGISQAQDANVQQERTAELVAASGGPASDAHLIAYVSDKAAVEVRDAEVVGSPSETAAGAEITPSPDATAHVASAAPIAHP